MNIFFRELKAYRKSIIGWSLGMVFLVTAGMSKYAAYQTAGQSVNELLASFPKSLQTIFGIGTFDLSTAKGFYAILFLYIAVMASLHAVMLGSGIISKEERDKTTEFLFVKPITRTKVVTFKLLAAIVQIVILNLVTLFSSITITDYYNKGSSISSDILLLMSGLFFLQLLFLSIGAAVAAIKRKSKTSITFSASIVLLTFILYIIVDLNDNLTNLKYLTPFKYFDAKSVLVSEKLNLIFIIISLAIIIICIYSTYLFYRNRDLEV